jgi:tetratricopeptide (TPR) repeat protein
MVVAARCPDRSQLERFLHADLPDEDASGVESHLEICDSCASSIHEISSQDPLMKDLQGGTPEPTERQVDALAERFCLGLPGLLRPGGELETTDLDPHPDGPGVGMTEEVFDFLAPAEAPGEIGRLGPYRVTGPIGAGGMGIVFRAEDPLLRRPVALKVMKRSLSAGAEARRRFLREAQAVAALEHDHVVAIYQAGEDRGVLFLAMPLLRGETLADRLRRERALPLSEAFRVAREVAEGLDFAHRRGLVHRDIKPANLWLEGERGRVKILDFGLSRSLEPEADRSQSGQIAGTPHYMSPEQASGGKITPLCDLFSLGCVLYQMTTGRIPFDGPDALAILSALAMTTPEPPDRLNPDLTPAASALIRSLLSRDPAARPVSARAVVEAIEAIERAPSPRPTSRRPRSAIGLALLVVLGISGAGAAFGPQVVRILGEKGQLVIETSDPGVRIEVKRGGQLVTIVDPTSGRRVDLRAGEYDIELSEGKDGLRLSTRRFTLERGGVEVVRVTMEPPPAASADAAHAGARTEIDRLTTHLRDRPDDPAALQARADAYATAGDAERAIADWDRAIAIEPTGSRLQARGWAHFRKRDLDRALADFREAIRLDPKAPAPHTASGLIYWTRWDLERARSEYDEAIQLDPRSAKALQGRGQVFI